MQAVVLAGGLGTRLRSVVSDVPKPMALINGVPFLSILLRYLKSQGVTEIILSVGYKSERILDYFQNEFHGMPIEYSVEPDALGTGGAIRKALLQSTQRDVLVVNGDTFVEFSLEEALKLRYESENPIIFVRKVSDVSRYGAIFVQNNKVQSFAEKASSGPGFINAGVYLLPTNLFDDHRLLEKFSFEEFLTADVPKRQYLVLETSGEFIDIGTPDDYSRAQSILS
jgi:D-glycero-alpha-D-manno-heptose 1-phosphate guanylyltransferase